MVDETNDKEIMQQDEQPDFIGNIFNKRENLAPEIDKDKKSSKPIEPVKRSSSKPEIDDDDEDSATVSKIDKSKKIEDKQQNDKPDQKQETAEYYKSELEKLQKSQKDTQKAFHENRKQLVAYKKAVEKLKNDGSLMDEEATMLLDHTRFEDDTNDAPVLVRYGDIWDKEIQYMRRYSSNPDEIQQHVLAFQHLMQSTSHEEAEKILDELSQYEDDEIKLTKQMLEIGRQYNDDIYADIHETGSIRKLKEKYSQKEKELQERLDKMEGKYNKLKEKLEDYDSEPSDYGLPSGTAKGDLPKKDFDIGTVFNSRYQRR